MAPRPRVESSTWMVTGLLTSKDCNEPGLVIILLISATASCCSGFHWNSLLDLVRSQRTAATEARLGMKRLRNWIIPRNVWRSFKLVEGSMLLIELTFPGSSFRPVELNMCPKNGSSEQPILHLSALKRTPA